jgi:hypothetical protein
VYQISCWVLIKNFKKIKIYSDTSISRHTNAQALAGGLLLKAIFSLDR